MNNNFKNSEIEYTNNDIENVYADFPGGIVYFQFDEKMTIEYFSDGILNLLGCPREKFIVHYNNSFRNILCKEDFSSLYSAITKSISEELNADIECRLVSYTGKNIWTSVRLRIKGENISELRIVANIIDVNEYKEKEFFADEEKEKYKQILNRNSNIYFEYSVKEDEITFSNSDGVLKFAGQSISNFRQRLQNTNKVHRDDIMNILNMNNYVKGKNVEFRFVSVDSTQVWCCIRAVAILDSDRNIKEIIGCIDNIDKEKREQRQRLERQQQDGLTQLYNRNFTQREIISYLANEGKDGSHAFMIVDIDNFNHINDTLGNLFGDAVLINISDNLKKIFYESDIVGRIGGDEFLIFIKDSNNIRMLIDKTEDIREVVRNTYIGEEIDNTISCSIGITLYPEDGTSFEELFRNADAALHKAKQLGKDRCEFFSHDLSSKLINNGKFFNDYKMEPVTRENHHNFNREITTFAFDIMSRTKDVNSAINLILDKIGRQFDATYVNIYEIDSAQGNVKTTYQWTKDGVKRKEHIKANFDFAYMESYNDNFDKTDVYCENDTSECKAVELYDLIQKFNIKSFIQSLIFENETIEGYVSIMDSQKNRKWSKYERDSLVTVTKVIASYLLKMRASQKMEQRLELFKNYDALTGLPSLVKFKQDAKKMMSENLDRQYVVVSLDFKNFKYINDTLGYDAGDVVLKDFADYIRRDDMMNICVSRVASDNFVLLFEYIDDRTIIDRIVFMSEKFAIAEREKFLNLNVIISAGASAVDNSIDDLMVPIDNANIAKKQAKDKNRSSCVVFDDLLRDKIKTEFEITNTMERALAHNEFKVYLQPKVGLSDGKLVGAEALIRWIKPDGSIMPPDKFIPLFEKNGFVVNLDFFVYEEVCKMFKKWLSQGIHVVPISVNVSRVHLYDIKFVDVFTGLVDSYEIPHNLIELELTESIFLDNTEMALMTMKNFREEGFKVSIDDFGAGYSSLNLLKNMTSDVLKLDKEFFGRGELQKEEEIIVSSIVNMAKQLNMKVLSEGVETTAQSKFLKEIACDMAQGFLFAKPMPQDSFELIMANSLQFNI